MPILPANQNPLGALPARFRRPRLLIVGFGDVGRRVAALPGMRSQRGPRVLALVRAREQFASVRACGAQPLLAYLRHPSTARASLAFYNTEADVDRMIHSISTLRERMGYGE